MNLIELSEKQRLAIEAVVYGCNKNNRLVGATFMKDIHSEKPESISFYEAIKTVYEMLEQPTIEAEPVRHGRWVKRGQDIFCSECDEESGYTWAGASRYSDYCPSCGAKMDKEE